jgi:hypothetical protein
MVPYFPKQISYRAIAVYLIALVSVSFIYSDYAMKFVFIALGLISVFGFFLFTSSLTINWKDIPEKVFLQRIFAIAVVLRLIWVIFSYYFYIKETGQPFEFGTADAIGYHEG